MKTLLIALVIGLAFSSQCDARASAKTVWSNASTKYHATKKTRAASSTSHVVGLVSKASHLSYGHASHPRKSKAI